MAFSHRFDGAKVRAFLAIGGFSVSALSGLVLLSAAGAAPGWLAVQSAAFVMSLVWLVGAPAAWRLAVVPLLGVMAIAALAASLWIDGGLEGVHRWIEIGPVRLHIGQLLLPAVVTAHTMARRQSVTIGLFTSIILIMLQPDFGIALAVLSGLVPCAALRRHRDDGIAFCLAAAAVAITAVRADPLLPVALVEGVLTDSWLWRIWTGPLALLGATALPAALVLVAAKRCDGAAPALALAAFWFGLMLASLIGAYPVPLLGYGASAVLGFALALGLLPRTSPAG